jgi:hypothetical protein
MRFASMICRAQGAAELAEQAGGVARRDLQLAGELFAHGPLGQQRLEERLAFRRLEGFLARR